MKKALFAILGSGLFATSASADVFSVNPAGTFLRTNSDPAPNALIINLSTLSFPVSAGNTLRLERLGNFTPSGSGTEFSTSMLGVFSSSNTLLASSNQIRIPGAIDAGVDFVTAPTFFGSLATDIAQDFFVDPGGEPTVPAHTFVDVQVPVGAQFLLICSYDSHYSTNADTNGDFAVRVTAVPEVHTLGLLGVGAAVLLANRRKRQAMS